MTVSEPLENGASSEIRPKKAAYSPLPPVSGQGAGLALPLHAAAARTLRKRPLETVRDDRWSVALIPNTSQNGSGARPATGHAHRADTPPAQAPTEQIPYNLALKIWPSAPTGAPDATDPNGLERSKCLKRTQ